MSTESTLDAQLIDVQDDTAKARYMVRAMHNMSEGAGMDERDMNAFQAVADMVEELLEKVEYQLDEIRMKYNPDNLAEVQV